MKSKIVSWIFLTIIICFASFSVKSCSDYRKGESNKKSITYSVTGYHHEPAGYKRSAHRYVFLHNDRYGDFTFEVSPKTFYDATQGQKTMTFNDSFNELMCKADNDNTREKLKSHKEDFGNVKEFNNNIVTIIVPFYVMFPLFWALIVLMNDDEFFNKETTISNLTWIIWLIGLVMMVIVSII